MLSAGERWDKLFLIQKGLIRLFYIDAKGNEFNKAFFSEGNCVWPVTPYDRKNAVLFNIATIEDCVVLECSFEPLYQALKQANCWELFALPFAERLVEQKFHREHDFLLLSAQERFDKFSLEKPELLERLADYHLASFFGITHVSLSRIKGKKVIK